MKKIIIYFVLFVVFKINNIQSKANEIKIIAQVNNEIITSYDLYREIMLVETIEKRNVKSNEKILLINRIINNKIKEFEIKKYKIKIDDSDIEKKINRISENTLLKQNKELLDLIYEKLSIEKKWNKLILRKFRNKLEINMNEINEKIESKKFQKNKDDIIKIEKMNKIAILSKTYFNEVKQKFYIKIL